MKCDRNIGPTDRNIRIIVGIIILVVGALYESWFALVGLLPIFSTVIKVCPLYWTCGINTYSKDDEKPQKEDQDTTNKEES